MDSHTKNIWHWEVSSVEILGTERVAVAVCKFSEWVQRTNILL